MTDKILIVNRGEIACRIMRTAKKMGLSTIAVYSEADMNSLHVQMADEAYMLGGSLASESYLDVKKIIEVIRKSGAKYVHPGYGFLSENYKFAQAVEKEGAIFVGPPSEAIKQMGDKIRSKKLAKDAGVNTIPGFLGIIRDYKEAEKIADKIGYPVIIKASAGGGGKGMRIVRKKEEVEEAFISATNEAKNSFSDGRIFMEKYIENGRHIEIQVVADKFGNVACLGERECSIQKNNQKVIEEAPSSFMDERTRKKMYAQAVSLAKKVGYYSVGTVECMMDKEKNFYFMEMNTRLQVEHAVTELITGYDLVELMIRIANGEELPFKQKDVELKGWAIECRVYAEDPMRGFLPSSGRINKYIEPLDVENVRVDTSVYEGATVSMFYDPMIAKLCTYGKDREEAIERMRKALSSYYINGISHNINFLETIMYNERFCKGDISTNFIKQEFSKGFIGTELDKNSISVLIGVAMFIFLKNQSRMAKITGQLKSAPVQLGDKWVVNIGNISYLCDTRVNGEVLSIDYNDGYCSVESSWQYEDSVFRGIINGEQINVKINSNNNTGSFCLEYLGTNVDLNIRSTRVAELEKYMPKAEKNARPVFLKAPITGRIDRFRVSIGDSVSAGAELVIIEAMKLENVIRAEHNLVIKKINFKDGDFVKAGDIVIEFEK